MLYFFIHSNNWLNYIAGWSSPVARQAHNLKVVGSNPTPATKSWFVFPNFQSKININNEIL